MLRAVGQQAVGQRAARRRQALEVGAGERKIGETRAEEAVTLCAVRSSYLLLLSVVSSIRPESLPLHELWELRVDSRP